MSDTERLEGRRVVKRTLAGREWGFMPPRLSQIRKVRQLGADLARAKALAELQAKDPTVEVQQDDSTDEIVLFATLLHLLGSKLKGWLEVYPTPESLLDDLDSDDLQAVSTLLDELMPSSEEDSVQMVPPVEAVAGPDAVFPQSG